MNQIGNGKQFDPIYWKHAVWKAFSGPLLVVLGATPTVVLGWDTMLLSGKIVATTGLFMSWIKAIDLLFDQTMARLAAGKSPMPIQGQNGGDTQHNQSEAPGK